MGGLSEKVRVFAAVYQNGSEKIQMIAKKHVNQWSDFPEQLKLKLTDHAVKCTSLEGTSH